MSDTDLCYMPATDLAAAIRTKQVSPVEVVNAVLSRIEQLNPQLNAFCLVTADTARQAAQAAEQAVMRGDTLGPLHGVPVSIKDLVITKGVRTMRGSKLYEARLGETVDLEIPSGSGWLTVLAEGLDLPAPLPDGVERDGHLLRLDPARLLGDERYSLLVRVGVDD